jgi:hypothetical protein
VCIKSPPPDLNCGDISYENFEVRGNDPHGFDRDNDGTGCESNGGPPPPPPPPCDRISYPDPDVCIPPYPPDLNCEDVPYKNFEVTGSDPHGFDRDNDGIGCESTNGGPPEPTPPKINNTKQPVKCKPMEQLINGKCEPVSCQTAFGPLPKYCNPEPIPKPLPANCQELYGIPCCDDPEFNGEGECYDEGDFDDCEEGFIDKGYGCEPIEDDGRGEPPICTPDGPECPPCPEGVEAGWCADEDERQDFDCGDEDMENDPRCKGREPVNGSEEPEVVVEELPEEEEEEKTEPPIVEEEPVEEEETTEEVDGQVE